MVEGLLEVYCQGASNQCIKRASDCQGCVRLASPWKIMMSPYYDEKSEHDTEELHAKEEFLKSITRGGLLEPSDMLYVICCHGWTLFAELSQQERNKILLLSFHYPRASFVEVFLRTLENESNTKDLLATECVNNHPFKRHIK